MSYVTFRKFPLAFVFLIIFSVLIESFIIVEEVHAYIVVIINYSN